MAATIAILGLSVSLPTFFFGVLVTLMLISDVISRWRFRKLNAFMASMPGPIPLPFIGTLYNVVGLRMDNVCEFLLKVAKQYPKAAANWFAGEPVLITGDLELTNAILASNHNIDKNPEYKVFKNGCAGIFTASGHEWRSTRKALTPGFKTNVPGASFAANYRYRLPTLIETLEKYADDGKEHDVFSPIHLCLMDLVFDNLFEARLDVQKKHTHLSQQAVMATEMMFERLFNPLLWPDWIYVLLGKQKKFEKITTPGRAFAQEALDQRIEARNRLKKMNPTAERPQTFMEVLLSNVDSGVVSKEDALEELVELGIAGTITTACAVSSLVWILGMFPEIQKKAYQEIAENCTGDEVTLDDLPNLVYVEMICKEALRHFTVPLTGRQLTQDLKVNDKITMPAGVRLLLSSWNLHHNSEYWEKPGEFYPEHFSEANERSRPKGAFIPFSSGPRNCPGSKYAMQSMKILTANILLHFESWSHSKPPKDLREIKYRLLFMMMPAEGHMTQIKRRQPKRTIASSG